MFLVPLARRSPTLTRSFDAFFDDTLLDRFFAPASRRPVRASRSPSVQVSETEQAYTVTVDLPGLTKDQVNITLEGRRVDIEAQPVKRDENKDGDRIVYSERSAAGFARSLMLPTDVDQDTSAARLENGVLTLTLAKRRAAGSTQIQVN